MKRLVYISGLLLLILAGISCNESDFLDEKPQDFFTTTNAYQTPDDIAIAVNHLYSELRTDYFEAWPPWYGTYRWVATDQAWDAIAVTHQYNLYSKVVPSSSISLKFWELDYQIIKDANVIIGSIPNVKFSSDITRSQLEAQAKFFRAWAYRHLAILFGGVPLVLKAVNGSQRDFHRAPIDSVWNQCIKDVQYAVQNLPTVNDRKGDGQLVKAAAHQLLAQIYMSTNDYQEAIAQTSTIINNPNYALMTHRFGSLANEPGDVYSDLFNVGNQNRSSGNTESIWVSQYEYNVPGGAAATGGNHMPWLLNPEYWLLKDQNGTPLFTSGLTKYGSGVGWMSSTAYMDSLIWENASGDIRNSQYNILRDIVANNPKSTFYGKNIIANGALKYNPNPLRRQWHAIYLKISPTGQFPSELLSAPDLVNTDNAPFTYRDTYIYRLAQTYLLRAEAYLRIGKNNLAAADINKIRERANAKPVNPEDVTLDYILDERARELCWEGTNFRRLTLVRMGKLIERVRKYNPVSGSSIQDYNNLLPIPSDEIERNSGHQLKQNPGY